MQLRLVLYIPQGQPTPIVPPRLAPQTAATNQSALTSTEAYANVTPVLGDTNASQSDAKETTPTLTVPRSECPLVKPNNMAQSVPRTVANTIHVNTLTKELQQYPNKILATYIINGFTYGFSIGYQGPPLANNPPNLKSASKFPRIITEYLATECRAGHTAGPFDTPPFSPIHISPLGVIPKKEPGKWRLIMHLSYPPGGSVNDGIPIEEYSLKYISVDTAMDAAMALGRGALMAKIDIKSAFRICPVRPEDWPYLGMQWDGKYYFDKVLPFGLRSAPYIFNCLAEALCWTLQTNYGIEHLYHYLDDFITLGLPGTQQCRSNFHRIKNLLQQLNIPTADEKQEGPATLIVFLGILLDTERLEARLPPDKLAQIKKELATWVARTSCTKRELLSLIGLLSFAAKVVPPGRTFLRRMIDTSTSVPTPDDNITLNNDFVKDIQWWHHFLDDWNGKSFFMHPKWIPSTTLNLFTDSSGAIGYGAYFDKKWFQGRWSADQINRSIQWKELFPIVLAAATWGHLWTKTRITFMCDNEAVATMIRTGTSKCPMIMELLRQLFYYAAKYNFSATAQHIPGKLNLIADALSRFNMQVFHLAAPQADPAPCIPTSLPSINI